MSKQLLGMLAKISKTTPTKLNTEQFLNDFNVSGDTYKFSQHNVNSKHVDEN